MRPIQYLVLYSITELFFAQLYTIGPLIPILARKLQYHELQMGFIISSRGSGMLIGAFGQKFIEKYFESHQLLAIACLTLVPLTIMIALIQNWILMSMFFFVQGLMLSIFEIYLILLTIKLGIQANIPQAIPIISASFALGAIIHPIIIANFQEHSLYLLTFEALILAVPYLLAVIDKQSNFNKINNNQQEQSEEFSNMSQDLKQLLMMYFFIYIGMIIGLSTWLPTFCYKNDYLNLKDSAQSLSYFWLSIFFGRTLSVQFAKLKVIKMIIYQTVSCLIAIIMSIIILNLGHHKLAIYILCIFLGLGISSLYPLGYRVSQEMKMTMTVQIQADIQIVAALGAVIIPFLMGIIMNFFGLEFFYPLLILLNILILAIGMYFQNLHQKQNTLADLSLHQKFIELSQY